GYSNYTLAVALPSQKTEDVIEGLVILITRLGGVTAAIVPDNMKSAVTKPDRYEPVINEKFLDMANYYGLAVLPARPGKPKDKAKVETHVNVLYKQVYARLRNRTFRSLEELNQALSEKVDLLNDAVMQDYGVSRKMLLERDERRVLKSLPDHPYSLVEQAKATVGKNGKVRVKSIGKYLRAPCVLLGLTVRRLTDRVVVRTYNAAQCVAMRAIVTGQFYSSNPGHLLSVHKQFVSSLACDAHRFKAHAILPEVEV